MTEIRWWCCDAPYGEHEPTCKNATLPAPEIVCCRNLGTCGHSLDPDSYCGVNHCSPHDRTERCELFGCVPYPTQQMDGYFEMRMIDRARVDPVLTRDTQETPAQRGQHGGQH